MNSGEGTSEHDTGSLPLKRFLENEVLPHIPGWERDLVEMVHDPNYPKEGLDGLFEEFMAYDPHKHNGEFDPASDKNYCFSFSALSPVYAISVSRNGASFGNMKERFLAKAQQFADALYRDAFFRNTYDTYEAWQSCRRFKDYQALFEHLGLLPEDVQTRIAGMSEELDRLWSQPEIEQAFREHIADEAVKLGTPPGSMLDKIFRNEPRAIPEEKYEGWHELRPDLFPEKYGDYLKKLEDMRHPYMLKL